MDAMRKIHEVDEAVYQLISPQLKEMIHVKSSEGMVDERLRILREPIRQTTLGGECESAERCNP
jgi:hypothetical protein